MRRLPTSKFFSDFSPLNYANYVFWQSLGSDAFGIRTYLLFICHSKIPDSGYDPEPYFQCVRGELRYNELKLEKNSNFNFQICVWVAARLTQRQKSTFFEKNSSSLGVIFGDPLLKFFFKKYVEFSF